MVHGHRSDRSRKGTYPLPEDSWTAFLDACCASGFPDAALERQIYCIWRAASARAYMRESTTAFRPATLSGGAREFARVVYGRLAIEDI